MSTSLILFISSAGVIQAMLLAALLYFHPKSDRTVNSFLSLHILTVSIIMLMPVLQYFFSWHSLIPLAPFQFLIGPFLYFYVRSFKETINWRKAWPHLLLFAGLLVINLPVFFSWLKKYPASSQPPEETLLGAGYYIRIILRNLQMLLYYFLALRVLNSYQRSIQHLYSETSRINLTWVKWVLNGYLLLTITVIVRFFLVVKYPEKYNLMILINTAIITPYIYLLTLRGLGQPTLWQIQPGKSKKSIEKEISEVEQIELTITEEKEIGPITERELPDTRIMEVVPRILLLMEKEKLYQEPELTLQALADKLNVPTYQVSQAINDGLNKNFYDLVNGYRVEEAKRLLLDSKNKNFTILSVGFEAGFNSKTTFNTVFKKFTGLTPTQYQSKQKSEPAAL